MILRFVANYRWEILLLVGMHAPKSGFWALLVRGPLDPGGVVFDLAWWCFVILLPLLAMAGLYMCMRRRGYGWEGLLLVAIPFWAPWVEGAYRIWVFDSLLADSGRWQGLVLGLSDWGIPAQLATVILLAALYPAVHRRIERHFLRLIWQFLLAFALIGVVVDVLLLTMQLRGIEPVFGLVTWDAMLPGSLLPGSLLASPFAMFLLFSFIRRASRLGLPHSLFMVALAFSFPWPVLLESPVVAIPETTIGLMGLATLNTAVLSALTGTAVFTAWLLFNFDTWGPIFRKRAVVALIAVRAAGVPVLMLLPLVGTGQWPKPTGDSTVLLLFGITFLAWSVVFCAAYFFSARRHEPSSGTVLSPAR